MLLKPVCVPCQRFFRPEKNGFPFIEGMPRGGVRVPPGTQAPGDWKPYKLWMGDKWKCQGCGQEIVVGVIAGPISEHYKPDFAHDVERLGTTLQVNDC